MAGKSELIASGLTMAQGLDSRDEAIIAKLKKLSKKSRRVKTSPIEINVKSNSIQDPGKFGVRRNTITKKQYGGKVQKMEGGGTALNPDDLLKVIEQLKEQGRVVGKGQELSSSQNKKIADSFEANFNKLFGKKYGGLIKKMKLGGLSGSQSTGSFFGDLKKAIKGGGASKLTKTVKVMKNDTLGGIAKKNNTTIKMLQDLNGGLKSADGQKTMEFNKDKIKVPDPQSFQGFRLKSVRTKVKKDPYKGQSKTDLKEMNRPIMDKASLKRQQGKVANTPDRNAPVKKAMGGKVEKYGHGGSVKGGKMSCRGMGAAIKGGGFKIR